MGKERFCMRTYITSLCEGGHHSTAKSYQDALNSFKCFCGMEAIPYAYINRNRLLCYQSWLLDKGRSLNTVSTYMRRIRHIYNFGRGGERGSLCTQPVQRCLHGR